jgi:hypothetical protein
VKTTNSLAATSLALGLVSVFAFQLVILPISALVTGAIALIRFDRATEKGLWMAVAGLVLGGIYAALGMIRSGFLQ